jgi:hypothetical protein
LHAATQQVLGIHAPGMIECIASGLLALECRRSAYQGQAGQRGKAMLDFPAKAFGKNVLIMRIR